MKEDQVPDCWVQAEEDGDWVCYVMLNRDPEFIDYQEIEHELQGIITLEVIETCRICGQCDVYYPL